MLRLTTLILLLAFSYSLHAQYEWAPLGATWTYNHSYSDDDFFPEPIDPLAWKYEFTSTADTIWNGMPGRIVGRHIHIQDGYQVYYVWDDALRLLYDFSLEQGDTVEFELLSCFCELVNIPFVVDSVAVDMVDGLPLKRIHTSPLQVHSEWQLQQYSYQEKIGRLPTHVFEQYAEEGCPVLSNAMPAFLRCYTDNDIHLTTAPFDLYADGQDCDYTNPELPGPTDIWGCNYLPVSTTELLAPASRVRIYPNPAQQSINLELEARPESVHFNLYHLSGIQAGQWVIPAGTSAQHIQLPGLPSGLYIWTLQGEQLHTSGKILVER